MYDLAPSMVKLDVPNFTANQLAVIPDTVNRNGDVNVHIISLVFSKYLVTFTADSIVA